MTMVGMTRRDVLASAGVVAAIACVGGVSRAFAGTAEEALLRPPGGQDVSQLLGACIRCDRCRSVCPHNGIDVGVAEDGIINMRTPVMDFHIGYCNGCDDEWKCIAACPTGALQPFDKYTQKMGMAVIDTQRCEAFAPSARCKYDCITFCPEDALSKDDQGCLLLDENKCWGCGMCVWACPSNSFRAYDGVPSRGIEVHPCVGVTEDTGEGTSNE